MQYKQPQKNNHGLIIGAIVLLVVGLAGYAYFSVTQVGAADQLESTSAGGLSVSPFSPEQLAMLAKIESLKLDDSLFKNPVFQNLEDWTVELVPEPVGKANPFAPFGNTQPAKTSTR